MCKVISAMTGCCVPGCNNSTRKGFRCFSFPADKERRRKWEIQVKRDKWTPARSSRLCEAHFTADQFEPARADGWKKLKGTAVPTMFQCRDVPSKRRELKKNRVLSVSRLMVSSPDSRSENRKEKMNVVVETPVYELDFSNEESENKMSASAADATDKVYVDEGDQLHEEADTREVSRHQQAPDMTAQAFWEVFSTSVILIRVA